jgi:hypothetical protein
LNDLSIHKKGGSVLQTRKPPIKLTCMQNYQSTMESPKLSIDTIVTETKFVQKEVSIPYYFKNSYGNLCKIVSPNYFLVVFPSSTGPFVCAYTVENNVNEIAKGTACTEIEFESAFSQAMMHLQLLNDDSQPSNERDVNEEIDEILERRAS